jgi:hypothetical protein
VKDCSAQAQRALQKVSHSKKLPGTAYPHEFQGNNPSVPLSQPLGLGQWDRAGRSPFHAVDSRPSGATETANGTPAGHRGTLGTPLPARYESVYSVLESGCPALVPVDRWQRCVEDGWRFLARWGEQTEALGWTARDLFGLQALPAKPHPSYSRLSRYDETGLIWLLQGRPVVALTETTAAIQNPTGAITTYRRHNKPALGPAGDSLDDLRGNRRCVVEMALADGPGPCQSLQDAHPVCKMLIPEQPCK